MAERLVLHVGTMKSGTSFVQHVLASNPEAMADAGAVFAGGNFGKQSRAVRRMFRSEADPENPELWRSLMEESRRFDGDTSVISMEFLSFAQPHKIDEILATAHGLRVEVILTVRDQFRAIPAQFQTYTRNFGTEDWESYLRTIQSRSRSAAKTRAHRTFHRAQNVPAILKNWSQAANVSQLTVVTVPPSSAPKDLLWQRFTQAARLAPDGFNTEGAASNESVGLASCDYLRRLNGHIGDVRPRRYREGLRPTVREVLAPLRDHEGRPQLDHPGQRYAAQLNASIHAAVGRHGTRVVGDLNELPAQAPHDPPPAQLNPPAEQVRRAAGAVIDYCHEGLGEPSTSTPEDVDEAVATSAQLLRRLRGWKVRKRR